MSHSCPVYWTKFKVRTISCPIHVSFMSHINIIHVPMFYVDIFSCPVHVPHIILIIIMFKFRVPSCPLLHPVLQWLLIDVTFTTNIFGIFSCPIHAPPFIIIINMLRFRVLSCLIFTPNVTFLISWCPIHVPCIWYIFMSHSCPRYYNDFKLLNISCPFMSSCFTWYDIEKWYMKTFDVPFMSYVS